MRDYLSPVLRESKFKEHGRITPEEFVVAGDYLVYKFPTWQWSGGDSSRSRDYLPSGKQFIVSRGVPCFRRVSQLKFKKHRVPLRSSRPSSTTSLTRLERESKEQGGVVEDSEQLLNLDGDNSDDLWIMTHSKGTWQWRGCTHRKGDHRHATESATPLAEIPDDEEQLGNASLGAEDPRANELSKRLAQFSVGSDSHASSPRSSLQMNDSPHLGSIPDEDDYGLSDFSIGVADADDAAQYKPDKRPSRVSSTSSFRGSDKFVSVRTYDCLITYDKYYQTPRMWLIGYDEGGMPLRPAQIFEDVASDYAQKTVTIEPFPHGVVGMSDAHDAPRANASRLSTVHVASIHPCKHASMMRKIIDRMNHKDVAAKLDGTQPHAESSTKQSGGISGAVRKVTRTQRSASGHKVAESDDGGVRVDQYLVIFLKFMSSIVPTIEIDATQAI